VHDLYTETEGVVTGGASRIDNGIALSKAIRIINYFISWALRFITMSFIFHLFLGDMRYKNNSLLTPAQHALLVLMKFA
jgi:hypothetical protein